MRLASNVSVAPCGSTQVEDEEQHIAVFADVIYPTVCIYTDIGPMTLTPEQALELARGLTISAETAASQEGL